MPVIEFVNHIELLAVDYGKVWRGENVAFVRQRQTYRRPSSGCAISPRLALSERGSAFFSPLSPPKENIRGRYLQKYPATLKLEDKWMV